MRTRIHWIVMTVVVAGLGACGGGDERPSAPAATTGGAGMAAAGAAAGYTVTAVTNGGTVTGTITFAGGAQAAKEIEVTKDAEVCARTPQVDESLVVGENKGVKDAVVSITDIHAGKGLDALGSEFVLDQQGCRYSPHVSLLPVGVDLKILNNDGILHNIHTYGTDNAPKNMAQAKFKKVITTSFDKPEITPVRCDVHAWMSAFIQVVDHPYHAITDANGAFTLTDVPAGTYTLKIWQEKLGEATMQVTVEGGASATADHEYPAAAAAD